MNITEAELARVLADNLEGMTGTLLEDDEDGDTLVEGVTSYRDAGVLTGSAGFVLRLSNGQEFQVTIVRSR